MWTVLAVAALVVLGCGVAWSCIRRRPRQAPAGKYEHRERRDGEPLGVRINEAMNARRRPS